MAAEVGGVNSKSAYKTSYARTPLFLTIHVTVATAERSFSKLKLIKNYLRSTMGQERLVGLAILSIESERARKTDILKIVDDFAERKARRVPFK